MRRLIDTDVADAKTQRAIAVLRQVEPTKVCPERARRVWQALDGARPRQRRRRPPAWLLAALLLGGATAAAAAGGVLAERGGQTSKREAAAVATVAAPAPRAPFDAPGTRPGAPPEPALDPRAPEATAPPPPERAPKATSTEAATPVEGHGRQAGPPKRTAPPPPAPTSGVQLVHEAAKALRRDRDPQRAGELLDALDADHRGPLAEEALALRIEAALARRDAKAAELASSYLARYPRGRYVELARKALRAAPRR
ncbi:MAG TPA: hypothetical protein VKZ49_09885 [Polyangiaceae bacterium]|nr:hypothetical protein [Polyangiaceae bacterium]